MNKNNFNLDIFFKELSNNISNASTCIEDMIKKANEDNDFIWKDEELYFNPNYKDLKENFSVLHNSLKYVQIISMASFSQIDPDYATEYGYLSSNKSDLSFLIVSDAYDVNISSYPIKSFKNIKKTEFSKFKNLILENYPKSMSFGNLYINRVHYNADYKWDLDSLDKLVDKSKEAKRKHVKWLKEDSSRSKYAAEYNSNITFYKVVKDKK